MPQINRRAKRTLGGVLGIVLSLSIFAFNSENFEISKNIELFITTYKKVDALYVEEINHSKVMRKGIDAMLNELDPYTVIFSESEVEDFRFQKSGQYGGIGASLGKIDGQLVITSIYENSPASKAGLYVGDAILEVDGKAVAKKSVDDLSELIKGEPKTMLDLVYERQGEKKQVQVERAEINVENVSYSGMLTEDIGYVKFENFRANAAKEVLENMRNMKKEGMEKFILDMRGNPGGLLREAVELVNLYIGANKVVVSTRGKNPEHQREYKTYKKAYDKDIPLVVLIDEGSASASEIVSGSMQDYDRGVVIGRTSYGKGLVQITQPLVFNSQLKVTTSKYYTGSGRCIQRLDYAQRSEDGSVPEIPDSLKREFKTQNGRTVLDGAGVEPDLVIEPEAEGEYLRALNKKHIIFKYANHFRLQNEEVAAAEDFAVTDQILADFREFAKKEGFAYETKFDQQLKKLEKIAEDSEDKNLLMPKLAQLKELSQRTKAQDFDDAKGQLRRLLELEIVERYYFRKGRAKAALEGDPDILRSIEVLNNPQTYNQILQPA